VDNEKGVVEVVSEKVWKFFSSVKLAVVLLIVLAIVSIAGTVIEQNQSTEKYLMEYSATTVQVFEALGLFDMYHTWWFILVLFLLTANLIVCSLERFPRTWSVIKAPLKPIDDDALKAVHFKKEFTFKGGIDKAEARISQVLAGRRYRPLVSSSPGLFHFYTQKGAYSRLGVYLTHLGVILVFVGALIGAFFGFKAFLNLPEGEASKYVYLRNEPMWDRIMDGLGIARSEIITDPRGGLPAFPMGFFLRCDDFEVDYYENEGRPTGMPKEYWSLLSVFDLQGRPIISQRRIEVNDPLTYRGITFYQSSYGTIPNAVGKVVLRISPKNNPSLVERVVVDPGRAVTVSSINRTIKVLNVVPFGMRDSATGKVIALQSRNDEFINPAVDLEVFRGSTPVYRTTVMKVDPGQPYLPEDYVIAYDDYWGARYTGLQVTNDPGVWVVYTGFILLCFGPVIAFFGSHRKLWVRIQDKKGQAVVTVAGSANRNRLGFERDLNALVEQISK
jgi:cytochrome c biogenesis protein